MHPVKEQIRALLAQAKGTRWDVLACRACGILSVTAGFSQYAGFIPGRTGAIVAGISGGAAALLPSATKAAGLNTAAYNQKTPFLKVLPAVAQTLLAGPSIIAGAKAAEADEAKAQAQADDDKRIAQQVEAQLTKLGIKPGTSKDSLSGDVPADLKAAFDKALPAADLDKALPAAETDLAGLTSTVTVADNAQ